MKRLTPAKWIAVMAALAAGVAAIALVGTAVGSSGTRPWSALSDETAFTIVFRYRLLKVLLAVAVGGSLAVCGVTFQALLRNPLADPYILGVSGGASFGAMVAIWVGLPAVLGFPAVPAAAFAGALGTIFLVYSVAGRGSRVSPHTLLLVGVIANAFFAAGVKFIWSRAAFTKRDEMVNWIMGELPENISVATVAGFAVLVLLGVLVMIPRAKAFNLMSLGEEAASSLGEEVERTKLVGFFAASLLTAAAVAVSGPIGFVGLVVPHLLRLAFGPDHRLLLPASVLGGGIFLALADAVARSAPGGALPVGVVTAVLGCPFFLYLLKRGGVRG